MKHIVKLTLSNPSHEHISMRTRMKQQDYITEGKDESEAINRATRHFRTLGFKVHSAVIVEQKVEIPEPVKAEPVALSEAVDYKALEKPTIMRIKSGETKPVDRTNYNIPPGMRKKPIDKKAALEAFIARRNERSIVAEDAAPHYIEEKLTAADPASKWIHDFVHSDNPKFDGKSKKERIQMALGAKYGAMKNEEAEQIDELKKSTLKSYVKKASGEMKKAHDYHQMRYGGRDGTDQNYMKNVYPWAIAKYDRRDAGVEKAKQKLAKEEAEQVDEANMRFDPEAAARPKSSDVKNFLNRDKNPRAAAASNKYIRRMTKLGGLGPNQTKKDTEAHMKAHFEEVEQTDEARKMSRAEWRLGTPDDVAKNHEKIYKKLLATDPSKAQKFLDSIKKKDVKEAADPGATKVVNKAVKTKKAAAAADRLVKIAKSKVNKVNMDPELNHDVKQSSRY